jgi:hypothetical protein
MSGRAVMGSIEEITTEIRRMSFEERVPKKVSLTAIRSSAKRLTVIMVEAIPRKTIAPIF